MAPTVRAAICTRGSAPGNRRISAAGKMTVTVGATTGEESFGMRRTLLRQPTL
jgi:hypothetical protein